MIDYTKRNRSGAVDGAQFDEGLRNHMIKVYQYMAAGLGISGFIAYAAMTVPAVAMFAMQLKWVWFIGILAMAFLVMPRMYKMSTGGAMASFLGYSVILSFAIAPMFAMYTQESIARVFFITSSVFLSMSLYGYTTKKDLTSFGTFAIIGVWGVFFAGIVNFFLQSSMLHFIASIVAVVASIALTAYDTQKIKQAYYAMGNNAEMLKKGAIIGAFQLYFDFVYMFIHLVQLLGDRR